MKIIYNCRFDRLVYKVFDEKQLAEMALPENLVLQPQMDVSTPGIMLTMPYEAIDPVVFNISDLIRNNASAYCDLRNFKIYEFKQLSDGGVIQTISSNQTLFEMD